MKIIKTAQAQQQLQQPQPVQPSANSGSIDPLITPPQQTQQQVGGKEGDYCVGLSINCDMGWEPGTDVRFMSVAGKDILVGAMQEAARAGKMKIVDTRLTTYGNNPQYGFTYYIVLGQSHMTLHTWPERFFFNIDVFTCGTEGDPMKIIEFLKARFKPTRFRMNRYNRGMGFDAKDADGPIPNPNDIKPV